MRKILIFLALLGLVFGCFAGWETEKGPLEIGTTMLERCDTYDGGHFFKIRQPGGKECNYYPATFDAYGVMISDWKIEDSGRRLIELEAAVSDLTYELSLVKGWTWQLVIYFNLVSAPY